jgi:hypothetical protein
MTRTLSFQTADDGTVLLEVPTVVFHLNPQCERGAGQLGISAGRKVRAELRNDGGHLLDYWVYHVG